MLLLPSVHERGISFEEARFLNRLIIVEPSPPVALTENCGFRGRRGNFDAFLANLGRILLAREFGQEVADAIDPVGSFLILDRLLTDLGRLAASKVGCFLPTTVEVDYV
jgi:hypothetical protein